MKTIIAAFVLLFYVQGTCKTDDDCDVGQTCIEEFGVCKSSEIWLFKK